MADAVDRIRKRLGGLEHKKAREALRDGDLAALADILLAYYDKAYAKQLRSRTPSLVVRTVEALEAAVRFCRG